MKRYKITIVYVYYSIVLLPGQLTGVFKTKQPAHTKFTAWKLTVCWHASFVGPWYLAPDMYIHTIYSNACGINDLWIGINSFVGRSHDLRAIGWRPSPSCPPSCVAWKKLIPPSHPWVYRIPPLVTIQGVAGVTPPLLSLNVKNRYIMQKHSY